MIDPLCSLPFLILPNTAMRSIQTSPKRRKYNNLGLIVSSAYLLLTVSIKAITYNKFEKALQEQNIDYLQIQNKPAPFNTILWTANVETEDSFLIGDYSFFDTQPIQFRSFPKNHHLLGNLDNNDKIQRMIKISKEWFIISEKEGQLYFHDLRFGVLDLTALEPVFVFTYLLREENGDVRVEETERKPEDAKKLLSVLGDRIFGN